MVGKGKRSGRTPRRTTITVLPCGHTVSQCERSGHAEHLAFLRSEWASWFESWARTDAQYARGGGALHRRDSPHRACHRIGWPLDDFELPAGGVPEEWGFPPFSHTLNQAEAEAWLRESRENRICRVCLPDILEPQWVKRDRRWVLAG